MPDLDPALTALRELMMLRFDALKVHDAEHVQNHKEMHAADQRAVDLALATLEKRLESMNEFRAQLDRQAQLFVNRDYLTAQLGALTVGMDKDIETLGNRAARNEARLDTLEKNAANLSGRLWAAGVAVGFTFTLLSLFLKFFVP